MPRLPAGPWLYRAGARGIVPCRMDPRLFLPTARQTNWLLLIGLLALGEALYLRYLAIEYAQVSLACQAGLDTWLCATFRLVIILYNHSVFGWIALAAACSISSVHRSCWSPSASPPPPSALCCTTPISPASRPPCSSSAWRVPRLQQSEGEREQGGREPQRLPISDAFVQRDVDGRAGQGDRHCRLRRRRREARLPVCQKQKRNHRAGQRREREIPIAPIEHQTERRLRRHDGDRDQDDAERQGHDVVRTLRRATENPREARHLCPRRQGGGADDRRY